MASDWLIGSDPNFPSQVFDVDDESATTEQQSVAAGDYYLIHPTTAISLADQVKAAVNALHVGEVRLRGILDKYGLETVRACIAEMKVHSEKMMRAHIEAIPDGVYTFEDYMDSDGVTNVPLTIHCEMRQTG